MTSSLTDFITTVLIGRGRTEGFAGWQARPTNGEIARLAYHLYEARGRGDGHDVDDWVLAERELARHYEDAAGSSEAGEMAALTALRNGSTLRS
jgi:Protein of unknown function (DUF2934)